LNPAKRTAEPRGSAIFVRFGASRSKSPTPSHIAYHGRDGNSKKGYWTRIGAAWAHADGHGFNIQIKTTPLDGRIALRIASEQIK